MPRAAVMRALRRFCYECQGGSSDAVRHCEDTQCALWAWRMPDAAEATGENGEEGSPGGHGTRSALRAIRRHCLTCAGSRGDVRACSAREDCTLWSFRFGVTPGTYRAVRARLSAPKRLSLF